MAKSKINSLLASLSLATALLANTSLAQELDGSFNIAAGSSAVAFEAAPTAAKARALRLHSSEIRTRPAKKKKKKSTPSPFPGSWYTSLTQKKNTCAAGIPAALNVGIKIESNLVAKDIFDGSPFFTGRILAADRIGFARSRTLNGCKQTQTYVLGNVKDSKGLSVLQSITECGANSCETLYSGNSVKK
jgi:hypothetical protein